MHTIYVDPAKNEEFLRNELYDGQLLVYSARKAMQAVIDHAAGMLNEAFAPFDPLYAQFEMPVEEWVAIFAALKPRFIHHPETMRLLVDVIKELGWDLDQWYVDVPRLRGVTSHGYLTTGVGYAHHPHRDNWWSAPMQQINFWLPIYDYESSSGMEFYPDYWGVEVPNSSNEFDYYDWNAHGRADAAKMIKADTRKQPKATIPLDLKNKLRLVVPVGGAQVFAACHLHGAVGNDTGKARFSLDWRVVHIADLESGKAPANLDCNGLGTSLRDFRRASDLAPMPDEIVAKYDIGYGSDVDRLDKVLVFQPD